MLGGDEHVETANNFIFPASFRPSLDPSSTQVPLGGLRSVRCRLELLGRPYQEMAGYWLVESSMCMPSLNSQMSCLPTVAVPIVSLVVFADG